jgi:predicted ATPase/class 3 adenylate cyclase/tRNA A-37 threonylcarbamoyl transferase component Bud32
MKELQGYQSQEQLFEGSRSLIFRAISEQTQRPVIVKILKHDYPTQDQILRFKREYKISTMFDGQYAIKANKIFAYENSLAIEFDDIQGESLDNIISKQKLTTTQFLHLAVKITECLGIIHDKQVIHKDLNPSNIVWNQQTDQLQLIDFGVSTNLPKEKPEVLSPNVIEGTLVYISPEQTGRMNRSMDYRTDFYSLGVTFYRMLTGVLPYESDDPVELIHCHIAKKAITPYDYDKTIPKQLSRIIMRLMEKTVEKRYQSSYGLKKDLQRCLQEFQQNKTISDFELGEKDISYRFQIAEKLYGRESEIEQLMQGFDYVSQGHSSMMLISGYSGIGKSFLIQEVHKPIVAKRGYFIHGKFEQFKRNLPYVAFSEAIKQWLRQILAENEAEVAHWKTVLLEALGSNAQILIELVPELSILLGKQPEIGAAGAVESENRFNFLFLKFLKVLATKQHPLVVFVDDLQWADTASLKLLKLIMTNSEINYLFFIGAYRDNEVNEGHPLISLLDELQEAEVNMDSILLAPLQSSDVNHWIADTLHTTPEKTQALSALCQSKTQGNPFFLSQFLTNLYQTDLVRFDNNEGAWTWSLAEIEQQGITDNVVDLMVAKIHRLSEDTQRVLTIAACIGNRFDLKTLSNVYEKSLIETADDLWEVLQTGLIFPENEYYKYVEDDVDVLIPYRFQHDRVQQAAYSLLDDTEKQEVHLTIGRLLLERTPKENRDDRILEIVNQFNAGKNLIKEKYEKEQLSFLNMEAGIKSRASIAYGAAAEYYRNGIQLLGEHRWQENYDLCFKQYMGAAESEYLNDEFTKAFALIEETLAHVNNVIDKAKATEILIHAYTDQSKLMLAINTALEILEELGVNFPRRFYDFYFLLSFLSVTRKVRKQLNEIESLPEMQDEKKLLAARIIFNISSATYFSAPKLYPLIITKHVELTLKYGITEQTQSYLMDFSILLCSEFVMDIDLGSKLANVALRLQERQKDKRMLCQSHCLYEFMVRHWSMHLRKTLNPLKEAFQVGLEEGELEYASYCAFAQGYAAFHAGVSLSETAEIIEGYINNVSLVKDTPPQMGLRMVRQAVANLLGETDNPVLIEGEYLVEKDAEKKLSADNHLTGLAYLNHLRFYLNYIFGRHHEASRLMFIAKRYLEGVVSQPQVGVFYYYAALTVISVYSDANFIQKIKLRRLLKESLKKISTWAKFAPMNFEHKYYLILAEKYRLNGAVELAENYYIKAIELSHKNGYTQEEALANELAAKFYYKRGLERIAKQFIFDAVYAYDKWGAKAKIEQLKSEFSDFFQDDALMKSSGTSVISEISTTRTTAAPSTSLDLMSIMKSTQAISSEIHLESLIKKILLIVVQNTGAQKSVLMLERNQKLYIEGSYSNKSESGENIMSSIPIESSEMIPLSIVQYVFRTHNALIIDDASKEIEYGKDPYVIKEKPISILCAPIMQHGELLGIFYLENNLAEASFTPEREEVLNLISSQVAISMENARLYNSFSQFVPAEFLQLLGKRSMVDIELGDSKQQNLTILFVDIRNFTQLSEELGTAGVFQFINQYIAAMRPVITKHHGFIDKYIGDAIMVLYPGSPNDAVDTAIELQQALKIFNSRQTGNNIPAIKIGVGISTGSTMLGIIGDENRMDSSVISSAVNTAAYVESLNKVYGTTILITQDTLDALPQTYDYTLRKIDQIRVKKAKKTIVIYEVLNGLEKAALEVKRTIIHDFEHAWDLYHEHHLHEAKELFEKCLAKDPNDMSSKLFISRCVQTRH